MISLFKFSRPVDLYEDPLNLPQDYYAREFPTSLIRTY